MKSPIKHALHDAIGEFCTSEKFYFVDSAIKPHAETVLACWINTFNPDPPVLGLEKALFQAARLNLPAETKKAIPDLLEMFFDFLLTNVSFPDAAKWLGDLDLVKENYLKALRSDGSIKGEVFRNKGAKVGRNAPCPCGSGKKFKNCCLRRIS